MWWILLIVSVLVLKFSKHEKDEIIVARFNEDISKLKEYSSGYRVTVYNKGPNPIPNSIQLPNVGFEAHTYLWHIVNRYDTLAPRTVFVMGSAISRNDRNFILKHLFDKLKTHRKSDFSVTCHNNMDLKKNMYNFQLDEIEKSTKENTDVLNIKKLEPSPERPYGKWVEKNFGEYPVSSMICYVPNFAVTREDIRKYPKSYYENLLNTYLSEHMSLEVTHYFERSWYDIFNH